MSQGTFGRMGCRRRSVGGGRLRVRRIGEIVLEDWRGEGTEGFDRGEIENGEGEAVMNYMKILC